MKNLKYYIGVVVAVLSVLFFLSDEILGVDLYLLVVPDKTAPEIDTSGLLKSAQLDGVYTLTEVPCNDNHDETCTTTITGSIDTSSLGEQSIVITATDKSGNVASKIFTVTVIEGIDPHMYIPDGYYDELDGLSDTSLINMLNDIITGHTEYPYTSDKTDVWDIMHDVDEDPNNSDNVLMFYTGISLPKECQQSNSIPAVCTQIIDGESDDWQWNREHIWSKSRGDFDEELSGTSSKGAHTDLHHLVPAERTMNSTKNNRFFEDCHESSDDPNDETLVDRGYGNYTCNEWSFEPRDEVKGDVARMIFYMVIRYEGEDGDYVDLELGMNLSKDLHLPLYGDVDDLLRWHIEDPVDMTEIDRNNGIYGYQNNRNPFIDMPELAETIWGKPEDYS
jgi:endonuclease I